MGLRWNLSREWQQVVQLPASKVTPSPWLPTALLYAISVTGISCWANLVSPAFYPLSSLSCSVIRSVRHAATLLANAPIKRVRFPLEQALYSRSTYKYAFERYFDCNGAWRTSAAPYRSRRSGSRKPCLVAHGPQRRPCNRCAVAERPCHRTRRGVLLDTS